MVSQERAPHKVADHQYNLAPRPPNKKRGNVFAQREERCIGNELNERFGAEHREYQERQRKKEKVDSPQGVPFVDINTGEYKGRRPVGPVDSPRIVPFVDINTGEYRGHGPDGQRLQMAQPGGPHMSRQGVAFVDINLGTYKGHGQIGQRFKMAQPEGPQMPQPMPRQAALLRGPQGSVSPASENPPTPVAGVTPGYLDPIDGQNAVKGATVPQHMFVHEMKKQPVGPPAIFGDDYEQQRMFGANGPRHSRA